MARWILLLGLTVLVKTTEACWRGRSLSPCDARPCAHDAECVDTGSTFECMCTTGYSGIQCEYQCLMKYEKTEGMAANSTTPYRDIDSIDGCEEACTKEIMCRGFDVLRGGERENGAMCWLRLWAAEVTEAKDGTDHYSRVPCLENDCIPGFNQTADTRIRYGSGVTDIREQASCAKACQDNPNCNSFDFVTGDTAWEDTFCWLHLDEIQMVQAANTDHYRRLGITCDVAV